MVNIKQFLYTFFMTQPPSKKVIFVGWLIQTFNMLKYFFFASWEWQPITLYFLSYFLFIVALSFSDDRASWKRVLQIVVTVGFVVVLLYSIELANTSRSMFTYDSIFAIFLTQNNPISTLVTGLIIAIYYLFSQGLTGNFIGTIFALVPLLIFSYMLRKIKVERDKFKLASITDDLTQLYNFSYMLKYGEWLMKNNEPYRVFIMDINNFKTINDTHGHLVGNKVIVYVANIIKNNLKGLDGVAGRFGGDEFIIVMKNKDKAETFKDVILNDLKNQPFYIDKEIQIEISVSMGEAISNQNDTCFEELLHGADMKMYDEKKKIHKNNGNPSSMSPVNSTT